MKTNAADVFARELHRARKHGPVTIFMSSSTDPYQPIEHKEKVTRALLEVMAESSVPDFLMVQTRSPLVVRDIDLFRRLGQRVRVSITIETDLDEMRRHFTPHAPPISARLKALQTLTDAGVPTQATVAPVLPSSKGFPRMLAFIVERVCIDDYFMGDGSGGRRTRTLGVDKLYQTRELDDWFHPDAHRIVYDRMLEVFPTDKVLLGQAGFAPNSA